MKPFDSIGTVDVKSVEKQIIGNINLYNKCVRFTLRDIRTDENIYRAGYDKHSIQWSRRIFDLLALLPEVAQQRLLKNYTEYFLAFNYGISNMEKLVEKTISFLQSESDQLFHSLLSEMTEKGTHLRDPQQWAEMQRKYVTEESLQRLESAITMRFKIKMAYPEVHEIECNRLETLLTANNVLSTPILEEISKSKQKHGFTILIITLLNEFGHDNSQQIQTAKETIIDTIHLINILNNICLSILTKNDNSSNLSMFWFLDKLSDGTRNGIQQTVQNFPEISARMLDMIFNRNGRQHKHFFDPSDKFHEHRLSLVLIFEHY